MNRLLPARGDGKTSDVTAESGMPVYTGQHHKFHFEMFDSDFVDGDDLGDVDVPVDEGNGWAIGTFTTRSVLHNIDNDGAQGNYAVTWEIRRTLLPDLTVKTVYLQDPLGTPFVCGDIRNVGAQPAPPAELTLSTEGTVLERFRLPALDVGWSYPHCVKRSDLPAKKHNLVFSIDELRELPEMEEFNNVGFLTVEAAEPAATGPSDPTTSSPAPGAGPSPQPGSSGTQADPGKGQSDLTVRAVRVNGQAPDGKNDCKAGRNDLIVVVKNEGAGDAGSFTVRLAVDGDNLDASVDGLDAGREREVRLDNVPLKSGQHALRAVADTEHAITETREDNNELKVSARCQG